MTGGSIRPPAREGQAEASMEALRDGYLSTATATSLRLRKGKVQGGS